jgi:type II secretory pathway predicted ATPase ExeA
MHPASKLFTSTILYREAFVALRYGIELRLGLIVLSGESGVGKTRLVTLLRDSAKKNFRLLVLSARSERVTSLLCRTIAGLGLDEPAERRAGTQALKKYLLQQSKAGQIVAIVIDDADELSPEDFAELKTLLSLRSEQRHLLWSFSSEARRSRRSALRGSSH